MKWKKFVREATLQIQIAVPVSWSSIMRKSIDIVAVIFVGHLGKHYLAAAGLATVTANVTGNSMLVGFSGAVSSLAGWAKGAKDNDALGLSLQRSLIILPLCICLPVTVLWVHIAEIMVNLGQKESIALMAQEYLLYLIPGLWMRGISICLLNWLYAQEYVAIVAYSTTVAAVCNVGLCYMMVSYFQIGYIGAAISISVCRFVETLLLVVYVTCVSSILKDIEFKWSVRCLYDWKPFFQLAVPSMLMMLEWWASEIITFLAGTLPQPELQVSVMSIYQNILAMCFMFGSCLRVAAATRVGNELGSRHPNKAKLAADVAPILALGVSLFIGVILLSFPHVWGAIFSGDAQVQNLVAILIPWLVVYVVADGGQSAYTGVILGSGRQVLAGIIVIVAYYLVGLPVSYILAFDKYFPFTNLANSMQGSIMGLCIGTVLGTWTHFLLFALLIGCCTNWSNECTKANYRLQEMKRTVLVPKPGTTSTTTLTTTYQPLQSSTHSIDQQMESDDSSSMSSVNILSESESESDDCDSNDDDDCESLEDLAERYDDSVNNALVEDWDFGLENGPIGSCGREESTLHPMKSLMYSISDTLFNTNYHAQSAHHRVYEMVRKYTSRVIPTSQPSHSHHFVVDDEDEITFEDFDLDEL